jgi:hypothetical protein
MKALLPFCPFFPVPTISVPNEENSLFPFKWGDIWKLPEGEFNCWCCSVPVINIGGSPGEEAPTNSLLNPLEID